MLPVVDSPRDSRFSVITHEDLGDSLNQRIAGNSLLFIVSPVESLQS